ncbi:PLDc_N domain-containing protein [bacterium]|nr:PLDc_N domain-containing protein [bacterium]
MFGIGHWEILIIFFVFGIGILGSILWIWMLIDCATKESSEGNDKLIWILIILFTHWIGGLIYLIVRRPKRQAELGR